MLANLQFIGVRLNTSDHGYPLVKGYCLGMPLNKITNSSMLPGGVPTRQKQYGKPLILHFSKVGMIGLYP